MTLGLTTGLILGGGIKKHFIAILSTAIVAMWTALILTNSRGALFSMFGQLAFVLTLSLWLKRRSRGWFPSAILGVCLLIAVGISAVWMGGDVLTTRLEALPGEISAEAREPHAGVKRREIWNATWQLFKEHPLVGSGVGAYSLAITRFHDASGKWTPEAAHNDYLELLATAGIVGPALALWFGATLVSQARTQLRSKDRFRRAACLGALTGIFGVVLHNFVDFGLHVTANAVAFVALVVIATRNWEQQSDC
jgi:O-antigen ligase